MSRSSRDVLSYQDLRWWSIRSSSCDCKHIIGRSVLPLANAGIWLVNPFFLLRLQASYWSIRSSSCNCRHLIGWFVSATACIWWSICYFSYDFVDLIYRSVVLLISWYGDFATAYVWLVDLSLLWWGVSDWSICSSCDCICLIGQSVVPLATAYIWLVAVRVVKCHVISLIQKMFLATRR